MQHPNHSPVRRHKMQIIHARVPLRSWTSVFVVLPQSWQVTSIANWGHSFGYCFISPPAFVVCLSNFSAWIRDCYSYRTSIGVFSDIDDILLIINYSGQLLLTKKSVNQGLNSHIILTDKIRSQLFPSPSWQRSEAYKVSSHVLILIQNTIFPTGELVLAC